MVESEIIKTVNSCFIELNGKFPDVNESLFAKGHLDSFEMLKFIMLLEEKFNIVIGPEDTSLVNFETTNSVVKFISHKIAKKV